MNNEYDYVDLEALVARARMERSVAIGNAIASVVGRISNALRRVVEAIGEGRRSANQPVSAASGH